MVLTSVRIVCVLRLCFCKNLSQNEACIFNFSGFGIAMVGSFLYIVVMRLVQKQLIEYKQHQGGGGGLTSVVYER